MHSFIHHYPRNQPRNDLVADENRHNGAGVADDFVTLVFELASHVNVVFGHFFSAFFALGSSQNVKLSQRSGGLSRVDTGCVDIGTTHVSNQLQDSRIFDSDEADVGAESFATGRTEDDIGEVSESLHFPGP